MGITSDTLWGSETLSYYNNNSYVLVFLFHRAKTWCNIRANLIFIWYQSFISSSSFKKRPNKCSRRLFLSKLELKFNISAYFWNNNKLQSLPSGHDLKPAFTIDITMTINKTSLSVSLNIFSNSEIIEWNI